MSLPFKEKYIPMDTKICPILRGGIWTLQNELDSHRNCSLVLFHEFDNRLSFLKSKACSSMAGMYLPEVHVGSLVLNAI